MAEPQYLSDPLFPLCSEICPVWQQGSAYFVDPQCLGSCSSALSQYACSAQKQAQLATMITQAASASNVCKGGPPN